VDLAVVKGVVEEVRKAHEIKTTQERLKENVHL
jgi:hypothetical protein